MRRNYIPEISFVFVAVIMAYNGWYSEIGGAIIFAGFVKIVVNSKKYKIVNEIFDTVF